MLTKMDHDVGQEINFHGDDEQDWYDRHHPDEVDHFFQAMRHQVGAGPHPGMYRGPGRGPRPEPREDTSEALAAEYLQEAGPAKPLPPQGPVPPQESVQQAAPAGGKKRPSKPPTGTTPTAIGEAAVKPEEPAGNF